MDNSVAFTKLLSFIVIVFKYGMTYKNSRIGSIDDRSVIDNERDFISPMSSIYSNKMSTSEGSKEQFKTSSLILLFSSEYVNLVVQLEATFNLPWWEWVLSLAWLFL